MATYFMFGKYSQDAVKGISSDRTAKATELIKKLGGKVKDIYALLGEHDLVLIVDLPKLEDAMKVSLELTKLTGIGFSTSPAVTVADFDKLIA